jgi:hypothetical protein
MPNDLDKKFLERASSLTEDSSTNDNKEDTTVSEKKDSLTTFEQEMKAMSLTKDDIIDMAIQLAEKGRISEETSILGGRIRMTMTSGKMQDSKEFVSIFEELNAKLQTTIDYNFNIYTVGLIVTEYNGKPTGKTVRERGAFMEEHIPMPIFKKILKTVSEFGRKVELMSEEEATVFF